MDGHRGRTRGQGHDRTVTDGHRGIDTVGRTWSVRQERTDPDGWILTDGHLWADGRTRTEERPQSD